MLHGDLLLQVALLHWQDRSNMNTFKECEEYKERVKACYGDWFDKLWGGSFDRANCDQATHDFRQCVKVRTATAATVAWKVG